LWHEIRARRFPFVGGDRFSLRVRIPAELIGEQKASSIEKVNRPAREKMKSYLGTADITMKFTCCSWSENALSMQVQFVNMVIWF
jgi:hypothetical protein